MRGCPSRRYCPLTNARLPPYVKYPSVRVLADDAIVTGAAVEAAARRPPRWPPCADKGWRWGPPLVDVDLAGDEAEVADDGRVSTHTRPVCRSKMRTVVHVGSSWSAGTNAAVGFASGTHGERGAPAAPAATAARLGARTADEQGGPDRRPGAHHRRGWTEVRAGRAPAHVPVALRAGNSSCTRRRGGGGLACPRRRWWPLRERTSSRARRRSGRAPPPGEEDHLGMDTFCENIIGERRCSGGGGRSARSGSAERRRARKGEAWVSKGRAPSARPFSDTFDRSCNFSPGTMMSCRDQVTTR